MNIIITNNNQLATLSIVSPATGLDYTEDFIANAGGFESDFTRSDDLDAYTCTQDAFDWWSDVIADCQFLEHRLYALREAHGHLVDEVVSSVDADLENHARAVNAALDAAFGA